MGEVIDALESAYPRGIRTDGLPSTAIVKIIQWCRYRPPSGGQQFFARFSCGVLPVAAVSEILTTGTRYERR